MTPSSGLEMADLPADAVEVGRIQDAWGVKGWFKVMPYSASPEALFYCRRWFVLPPERGARCFEGGQRLRIDQARAHGDGVVASARGIADRDAAGQLKGARVFVARSDFPTPEAGEYYWVDLIGLAVFNRQGVALGRVADLMSSGPQSVLVVVAAQQEESAPAASGLPPLERLIPFVDAFVDSVDLPAGRITVDWQPDY
ncbi:MAG: ribosome maturation factor RimM [Burkholderiaceae bacterium]|jgi:16S rRNA processing protein RimM|nr:ribosome maturation factor RimM [Burkholderiaceae bacterium]